MRIEGVIWLREVVEKLATKHRVRTHELEEVLENEPKFRFMEQGERKGEDVYIALGRTDAGRHLAVLFIRKRSREALILSARTMAKNERRRYAKA